MLKNFLAVAALMTCLAQGGVCASETGAGQVLLSREHIDFKGELVSALPTRDKNGQHLLVLTQKTGLSEIERNPDRNERIDLRAVFYTKENDAWRQTWTITDYVDCPHLDFEASFFSKHVAITDVNGDGINEITVPYSLFCGGGIDSRTVKVIMRQGSDKFAIRGQSLLLIPGQQPFGGDKTYDKALSLPENAAFKKQLDAVWKAVYVQKY